MFVFFLTCFTLVAFAANSLFCRMALGGNLIDPISFTTIRLVSGAAILIPVSRLAAGAPLAAEGRGSWGSGLALYLYAAAFSLAYLSLDIGMGALILFASVQATMIGVGLRAGERPLPMQWLGLVLALGGLVYLVHPGIAAPDPLGACLMLVSGIAWGVYSVRGKGSTAPIASTAGNFVRAALLAGFAGFIAFSRMHVETGGIFLALVSGMITSGLGYVLWYKVVRRITTTQAAIVQLPVPVLTAFAGVVFLAEKVTIRLVVASVLILAGVGMAVLNRASGVDDPRRK